MAVKSIHFIEMEKRVKELEQKFLSNELSKELLAPLTYQADLDQLAAFKLLVHAEIEDYIERKAKESLNQLKMVINTSPFQ